MPQATLAITTCVCFSNGRNRPSHSVVAAEGSHCASTSKSSNKQEAAGSSSGISIVASLFSETFSPSDEASLISRSDSSVAIARDTPLESSLLSMSKDDMLDGIARVMNEGKGQKAERCAGCVLEHH